MRDFYGNELRRGHVVLFSSGTSLRYGLILQTKRGGAVLLSPLTPPKQLKSRNPEDLIRVNSRNLFSRAAEELHAAPFIDEMRTTYNKIKGNGHL